MQYAHPPSPPLPASLLNTHSRLAQQHSTFFTLTYYWPLVSPGRSAVGVFLCFFVMLMTNWSCAGLVRLNAKLGELGGAGAGLIPYVVKANRPNAATHTTDFGQINICMPRSRLASKRTNPLSRSLPHPTVPLPLQSTQVLLFCEPELCLLALCVHRQRRAAWLGAWRRQARAELQEGSTSAFRHGGVQDPGQPTGLTCVFWCVDLWAGSGTTSIRCRFEMPL